MLEGDEVTYGNVGDSRTYWIPDPDNPAEPVQLSVDDSVAQARILMGVPREEAENGPQAHAITKWLGRDSPDFVPSTGSVTLSGPGWLMVCSDGLWNYTSEASALQSLIAELSDTDRDPLKLCGGPGRLGQRPRRQGQHLGRPGATLIFDCRLGSWRMTRTILVDHGGTAY